MRFAAVYLGGAVTAALLAATGLSTAVAQPASAGPAAAPAPMEPPGAIALPLPEDSPPGSPSTERWVTYRGQPRLTEVTQPTLTPFLPRAGTTAGAAVIVAPGGGFVQLAIEKEGWNVARWLADQGIAAFVLKYRLISRSKAGRIGSAMAARPAAPAEARDKLQTYGTGAEDMRAAIRLVRTRAEEWGVDPDRIGAMGFSAGATLALSIATDPDPAVRPNFVVPVYAPAGKIDVPHNAPPMFAAIAADDGLFAEHGIGLVQAWHDAERPVEFHLYEAGGHGFGVPGVAGTTTTGMMDQLLLWLQARQLFAQTEP
jgi:acetyl esterase/lipase